MSLTYRRAQDYSETSQFIRAHGYKHKNILSRKNDIFKLAVLKSNEGLVCCWLVVNWSVLDFVKKTPVPQESAAMIDPLAVNPPIQIISHLSCEPQLIWNDLCRSIPSVLLIFFFWLGSQVFSGFGSFIKHSYVKSGQFNHLKKCNHNCLSQSLLLNDLTACSSKQHSSKDISPSATTRPYAWKSMEKGKQSSQFTRQSTSLPSPVVMESGQLIRL